MAESTKLKRLAELSEKALRDTVLAPLLARMGYKGVTVYHGPQERGKDIVCYREDELGEREYQAVVAKAVDLSGSVSSADGSTSLRPRKAIRWPVTPPRSLRLPTVTRLARWNVISPRSRN